MTEGLPPGWALSTLANIASWGSGGTPKRSEPRYYGGDIPWAVIGDLNDGKVTSCSDSITREGLDNSSCKLIEPGTVLIAMYGSIGKLGITGMRMATNQAIAFASPDIDRDYLFYFLLSQRHALSRAGKGATQRNISQTVLKPWPIPIAPLAEQERIVAAIEEHFTRLDAAETALCAARRRLDALLQSALKILCDGSWAQLPLGQISQSLKNGVFVSRPSATPPGYPIYRISAVRPLVLRIDDVRYADPVPNGASSYAVEAGDILFTRYSGNPDYVGAAAVVPHEGAGVLHPDKLIRVVADRDVALPEWIAAYVTAGTGRREVEKRLKTTAGQVGISGSQLGSVPIAVPPMSYQQQATDRIGHVLAEQRRIRQILSSTETTVGALRRSILSVAFSGRLMPQDPIDEPAPVLLERIAASLTAKPKEQKVKA